MGTNIQHLWSQLRERATRADIIPPYTEFLRLPFLSRLQQGEATLSEDSIFDHTTVQQIKQEIDKWVIAFKGSLQVTVVDHPGTEHDEDAIHPTERFTTVFACESCSGRLYAEGTRDLDLQGICDHTNCLESWIPAKFSHDMVRSNILRAVLVNNQLSENHIHNRLDRFQCMKCPFPLVLHGASEVVSIMDTSASALRKMRLTYSDGFSLGMRGGMMISTSHIYHLSNRIHVMFSGTSSVHHLRHWVRFRMQKAGMRKSIYVDNVRGHRVSSGHFRMQGCAAISNSSELIERYMLVSFWTNDFSRDRHDIVLVTENDYFVHHQDLVTAFQF